MYKELGYTAQKQNGEVVIPKVPCTLGARGGSDDDGLTYWPPTLDPAIEQPSVQFDKLNIALDNLRLRHARLDLAGMPKAFFADANLERVVQADNGVVFQAAPCVCNIAILNPPPPRRAAIGMKSIEVTVRYTADCKGNELADCAMYIVVDNIDNLNGKRVDSRTTVANTTPPTANKEVVIKADTDMNFGKNDAARIAAMLVYNECTPAVAGPNLLDIPQNNDNTGCPYARGKVGRLSWQGM